MSRKKPLEPVTTKLPDRLLRRLAQFGMETGLSRSESIRVLLDQALSDSSVQAELALLRQEQQALVALILSNLGNRLDPKGVLSLVYETLDKLRERTPNQPR